jgi:hypothetical protein
MNRAKDLVEQLAETHGFGSRIAVQLMHFNLLLASPPVSEDKLTEAISRVVNSAILTGRTFKT